MLLAFALMIFSAAPRQKIDWDLAPEIAFEMTILACGATAAIFENESVAAAYANHAATMAIGVVAFNLVLAASIVLIRYRVFSAGNISKWYGWPAVTLFLGALALFITSFS